MFPFMPIVALRKMSISCIRLCAFCDYIVNHATENETSRSWRFKHCLLDPEFHILVCFLRNKIMDSPTDTNTTDTLSTESVLGDQTISARTGFMKNTDEMALPNNMLGGIIGVLEVHGLNTAKMAFELEKVLKDVQSWALLLGANKTEQAKQTLTAIINVLRTNNLDDEVSKLREFLRSEIQTRTLLENKVTVLEAQVTALTA